ncbi:MAG: hypothetical protein HQM03_02345 [Magnetococcales bacterium]|nr:hypothetical protein [Magnetococcales bacterium]
MKNYIKIILLLQLFIPFLGMPVALWSGLECFAGKDCGLVRYQFDKLDNLPDDTDIVFLGDSSLGHSVDSNLFTQLSGKKSVSLALTGFNFNIPGMYNMLHHIAKNHNSITLIFMMSPQNYDIDGQNKEYDIAMRGVLRTLRMESALFMHQLSNYSMDFMQSALKEMISLINLNYGIDVILHGPPPIPNFTHDYQQQQERNKKNIITKKLGHASHRYAASLRAIPQKCRESGLRCLYLHGPTLETVAKTSADTINDINKLVTSTGLDLLDPNPIPIPAEELGDTINHVAPAFKQKYTKKYFELLKPLF